jgi:hypothetical protein
VLIAKKMVSTLIVAPTERRNPTPSVGSARPPKPVTNVWPLIRQRVLAGEITPHGGMIEAGFRKPARFTASAVVYSGRVLWDTSTKKPNDHVGENVSHFLAKYRTLLAFYAQELNAFWPA